MQAWTRRLRSPPRIVQDSSNKARRRKLFSPGAMADFEENFLNGHQHSSFRWTSHRSLERARPKVRKDRTPIRYLRKEILPIPTSQKSILYLLVLEEARRAWTSPLLGNRRGLTSPRPGQRRRE